MTPSIRQFMIVSILGITVLLVSLLYFQVMLSKEYLKIHLDTHNKNLAIVLRNSLVAEGLSETLADQNVRISSSLQKRIDSILEHELEWVPVIKVKVYGRNSVVIYSTRESEIGESAERNLGVLSGLKGQSMAGMVEPDHFNEFDHIIESNHIHQQYVPIADQQSGAIVGVFEIYTDIAGIIDAVDRKQQNAFATIGVVLVVFYMALAVVFLITHRKLRDETRQRHRHLDELNGIHKELERRVIERTTGLEQSEARLQSIMDHVPEAILTCDADHRILSSNNSASRLFNTDGSSLAGNDFYDYISGDTRPFEFESEDSPHKVVILKRGDGTVFPADLWIGSIELSKGITSYIVVIRDLTDQLRAQEEVESTRQQYFHQEKMAAIGQLAAGILHEVGNPIAAIAGAAQELKSITAGIEDTIESFPIAKSVSENVNLIDEQTTRLSKITRDIADFASPKPRQRELLDLNGLLRRTAQILTYDKRFRNRKMDLQLDKNLPAIVAVSDQLTQVFMNLLINAIDASEENDQNQPDIVITSEEQDDVVHVIIKDRGTGMSKDILNHATEAFFTTKPTGKGTGLGLSLCTTIVESHGGEMKIESQEGVGTSVHVFLPIDLPEQEEAFEQEV